MKKIVVLGAVAVVVYAAAGHAHRAAAPSGRIVYGSNEALANSMLAATPMNGPGQAACLDELWTEESAGTWSPAVTDPLSGAYGIPQALPAGKMASAGADWQTSAATQIKWGLGYIRDTYGTPCAAWAHETSTTPNWY